MITPYVRLGLTDTGRANDAVTAQANARSRRAAPGWETFPAAVIARGGPAGAGLYQGWNSARGWP